METVAPFKEAADMIKEMVSEKLLPCWQCGLCTATCPWNTVRTFIPHRMVRQTQFGLFDLEAEDWWLCTTCKHCVSRCPRGVGIMDIMRAARAIMVENRMTPASLRNVMASLGSIGNPMGEPREKRFNWAKNLNIKEFDKDTALLYFSCCTADYDPNATGIAQATAGILQKMGENFGILGAQQSCCGESINKAGNESLFQQLATSNIAAFTERGIKEIIVSSPHCYTTFKDDYPKAGGNFKVTHFTQYLAKRLDEGKLKFTREMKKKVVYHDPCYLGRHNGIYDEPRKVLSSIPGIELMNEVASGPESLCCGGGAGRIWQETKRNERFSDILVDQAIEMGANILTTACPYCIVNFKDSVLTKDKGSVLEVMEISEIVNEVI